MTLTMQRPPLPGASAPEARYRRRLRPAGTAQTVVWVLITLAVLGPILPLLYASLRDRPLYQGGGHWTLAPYRQLFSDPAFWNAARNTAEFGVGATVLAVIIGAVFAVLCARTDLPGTRVLSALVIVPIVMPGLGLLLGWNTLYGQGGYVTGLFSQHLGITLPDLSSVTGMSILGGCVTAPITFLTCRAALTNADSTLEDAARSSGASAGMVLRRVTLPLLRPALLNSALLTLTLAIEALGIPLILGQPRNINFLASYLYSTWSNATSPDPGSVSAGAMVLLVIATVLLFVRSRLIGAEARFVAVSGRAGRTRSLTLGWWRWPAVAVATLYVLLSSVLPLLGLVLASGVRVLTPLIAPWRLITGDNYRSMSDPVFSRSITNSILIAFIGALVTTVIVAAATLVAHRSRLPMRRTLPYTMLYPRAIPGIIIGIGFFWTFLLVNPPGSQLRNSIWGIALALSVRSATLAYVVLYPSLSQVSEALDNAGRASGAGWLTVSRRIVLPQIGSAVFAAFVLMFVSILNDYDPAVFLVRPGNEIIGVTMLDSFAQGATGPVAALACIQVAITIVVLGLGGLLVGRRLIRGRSDA
ncbi:ABC transporter permease [Jatrophihabitans lederbergiae]|uniref:Iron ABC transporter permease n=1 Tax=Jatrophihabitans lederbergiae TaxID=3075547 RepID=A0ABU2JFF4_9ACTN|nr:iron ABC transporter permease [Jatrophihabitans sp. DSM 44399]MDT0263731.1 iron ABC transporter permease [Jatrophihabitans sp. DSM 44399]